MYEQNTLLPDEILAYTCRMHKKAIMGARQTQLSAMIMEVQLRQSHPASFDTG